MKLVDWETHLGLGMEYDTYHVGDGGFIAQFSGGTVTNAAWKVQPYYIAPLDNPKCVAANRDSTACASRPTCADSDPESCQALHYPVPADWMTAGYDDSAWSSATVYAAAAVTNQPAYTNYTTRFNAASFIWSRNLNLDNLVLARRTVGAPQGGGGCTAAPSTSCRYAMHNSLSISNNANDSRDSLSFALSQGDTTSLSELADPTTSASYALCVYARDTLAGEATVPPAGTCNGRPCWVAKATGYAFKDAARSNAGISSITLRSSNKARTRASLRGSGINLPDVTLPLSEPVIVQLRNTETGLCFSKTYSGPEILANDAAKGKFKAKGGSGTIVAGNCALIQASTAAYAAAGVSVDCSDTDYGTIASRGLPNHVIMNGITATNLQVPVAQDFTGDNAWKIPLNPAIAAIPTSVVDGPIGVAVNGVPIFNPCKQGGCQNGDTKALGELDICNGHAGRADDYHYHAAPVCLMADQGATYWDTHPVGWALDGFAIFGYHDADGSTAIRDGVCGGNTLPVPNAPAGYSYHVTDTSPYVMSCLRGTPSPDLAGQGAKFTPLRQPPVTPFAVSNMTLTTDPTDGYEVLQFSSAIPFTTTETGSDRYANSAGTYRIRYKAVTGTELATLLAQRENAGKSACWNFQFTTGGGTTTQPTISYCR